MALIGADGIIRGRSATASRLAPITVTRPAQARVLAEWLVHAPGQAEFWSHYLVTVLSLAPIEGCPPAAIRVTGATHEIMLASLDEDASPRADNPSTLHVHQPSNVALQWIGTTDTEAVEVADTLVKAVCDGWILAEPAVYGDQSAWETALRGTLSYRRTGSTVPPVRVIHDRRDDPA